MIKILNKIITEIEFLKNDIEISDEVDNYINENFARYFKEEFFEELKNEIRYKVSSVILEAKNDYEYDKKHKKDIVTYKDKYMYFGNIKLPAYWYKKSITAEDIAKKCQEYQYVWRCLEYRKVKYPLLENWNSLSFWENHFTKNEIKQMEKALEREDKNADDLNQIYGLFVTEEQIRDVFPHKIKKILKATKLTKKRGEERYTSEIEMKLFDGRICRIILSLNKRKKYCGATALDKGFPWFTKRDIEMLEEFVKRNA